MRVAKQLARTHGLFAALSDAPAYAYERRVTEEGVTFRSYRDGARVTLTPESSVAAQKAFGADIILPLDELPPYHITPTALAASTARSHRWMARSLRAHLAAPGMQAMYGIVHGGTDGELRAGSAAYLCALPFGACSLARSAVAV